MLREPAAPFMNSKEQTIQSVPAETAASRVIRREDAAAWEAALAAVDPAARFLCSDWTELLQETYGYAPRLVALERGGRLVAALPFVVARSPFTGTRGVSLPFFDICRAYTHSDALLPELYQSFVAHGKAEGWDYLELRGDIRKLPVAQPSLSFYNHVVDLSGGSDAVFAALASSARRAIRKARKEGVAIETSQELSAIKTFYGLQCVTRKRHGLPPQPFRFFKNLHQRLIAPGRGLVVTARVAGEAVASSVYLEQGDLVHYKYGASNLDYQNARCNNLVMWTALERYAQRGFASMDLGRNSLENDGLRRYKLSWGASERLTHYHRLDLKTGQTMRMSDDVYGWHNRIFAQLPRPLARLAGALLYKHIA